MIGRVRKPVIWEAWRLHFDNLGVHRGTLGHHFGDPVVPRDPQQDTSGSRPGFPKICNGFGGALGVNFGKSVVTFSGCRLLNCSIGSRVGVFAIWDWKLHWDPMLGCA